VQVALERVDSHVEVSVSDTGIGITSDTLPLVFERFWQADSGSARRQGGLGLGLAIVRHLIESHGGEVRAHSDGAGSGSVFTVTLPVMTTTEHLKDPDRRHPKAPDGTPRSALPRLDGVAVLVVDDEPDSNEMVRTLLSSCGAEVRVAASSAQALEIFDRWRPSVLVSDIGMPGEDGYVLIRKLRERTAARGGDTPAIALTAYARVEDRVKVLTAGFQMHVIKPVDPAELAAAVASVAAAARMVRGDQSA
jgi:CheY-like chemotaxis protein